MKIIRSLVFLVIGLALFVAGYGYQRWYAKPDIAQAQKTKGRRVLYYVDPMNPGQKHNQPGKAPDGMDLQPVYEEEPAAPQSNSSKRTAANLPMGTIQINPARQQLIGVQYGLPTLGTTTKTIRAVGKVAPDEKRISHIHTRVDAWIDKVFVDFTGRFVERNQPLLTLYSPDMLATEEEFLIALKSEELMKASTLEGALGHSQSLLAATRRRLQLWELSDQQIDEIARTRQPVQNTTLFSPVTGYVTARNAFPHQRIMPDTELYTIVDLSRVWIMADVFEAEASLIRLDQAVTITLAYGVQRTLRGRVDYIQPQVDPMTRTLKVRIDAENLDLGLKPDMFVDVDFRINLPQQLTVPVDAVLDSGLKKTVFVDRGNGYLEPREVEIGERLGDRMEILRGLKLDERIVTSGTFLIDSESQLKAAASGMGSMPGMPGMQSPKDASPAAVPNPPTSGPKPGKPKDQAPNMPNMPGMK
jgi:RND family efflux transporter MFP subunit